MAGLLTGLGAVGGFLIGGPAGTAIGASIGSGLEGQQAANDAANAQRDATNSAIAENRRQFDITQGNLQPFQDAGVSALHQQQILLGQGTKAEQDAAFAAFADSPAQAFLRNQQERALLRNTSAIGGLGGGNVRTALQDQAYGRALTDYNNQFARLGQIAGQGQAATTRSAQFGAQAASDIGQLQVAGGQAQASGILGQQQANAGMVNNLVGLGAQFGAFGTPSSTSSTPTYAPPIQPSSAPVWT